MTTEPLKRDRALDAFVPTRRSLLSRLRNLDDKVSWQDFFETYWKLIYRTATKAGLSDADAQDVVMETVRTVVRVIGRFKYDPSAGAFKGWLLKITRWRILDHLRHRRSKQPPSATGRAGLVELELEQLPDRSVEQINQAWEAEWQQNLFDAAMLRIKRQVKPKHFQAFELYVLKAWPVAKVADALGMNAAHIHLLKHRVGRLVTKEVARLQQQGV